MARPVVNGFGFKAGRQLVWVGNQRVDVPKLRTPPISAEKAKLGGSYAGGSFEIQPEAEEIAVRIRGPIEQEVVWYLRVVQDLVGGLRHAAAGAAVVGLGYYVLHQHVWRGTGENIAAVKEISHQLGKPRVVVKEHESSIWDGTESKAKKDWNRTVDRVIGMTYWRSPAEIKEKASDLGKEVYQSAKKVDDELKVVATIASLPAQVRALGDGK